MKLGLYKSKGRKDIEVLKIEDDLVFFIRGNVKRCEPIWYIQVFFKLAGYTFCGETWD